MDEKRRTAIFIIILVVLGGFIFMYRLNVRGLAEPDEGRYAEIAREMLESGDWIFPRLNYILHMHKPPMSYWLIASSFSIFGVNEFAARFPSAAAAIITVIATFFIGKRLAGATAGFVAGIILITMPQFIGSARLAFPDMFLTCFVTIAFASFIKGCYVEKKTLPFLSFWLFAGLGMMTKGPVTLVLLLVPVIIHIIALREWSLIRRMQPVNGIILFLIISLPWYIFVMIRLPGLLDFFLGEQTLERLTSSFREVPRFFLIGAFVVLSFPWLFYYAAGIGTIICNRPSRGSGDKSRYLVLIWFFVTIIFFSSLRSSIASYILPAYPPLAIITAMFLTEQFRNVKVSSAFILSTVMTALAAAALAVTSAYYYIHIAGDIRYAFLQNSVLILVFILGIVSLLTVIFLLMRKSCYVFVTLALLFPALALVFLHKVPEIEERFHWRVKGKHLAEKILEMKQDSDEVVMMKQYYADLPFYLRRPVLHLHIHREKRFEDSERYNELVLFGDAAEKELIESKTRTFFVAPKPEYQRVISLYPDDAHFILEVKGHVLFCNEKVDLDAGSSE